MKKYFLYLIFCISFSGIIAQPAPVPKDHSYYIHLLNNAKDSLYSSILRSYDQYIKLHPADFTVQIERCRLMETAFYDPDEEYNPKYDECKTCKDSLLAKFPDVPEVIIYGSESSYGDSSIAFCLRVVTDINTHPEKWKGKEKWKIYEKLANAYNGNDKPGLSIKYGLLAAANNDTLDLTLMLARQYKTLFQNKMAIAQLLSKLDSTKENWELTQKGQLLLELGVPDKALEAFNRAKKDTSGWMDNGGLADAMIANGLYEDARIFLVKDLEKSWDKTTAMNKLFDYDLKYSIRDTALASYKRLVFENFMQDPIGVKRIRLFFRSPLLAWSFYDMMRLLLLLTLVLAIFVVPYLWILPMLYIGNYFKNKGMVLRPSAFRWGLKHFWIASSLILLADILATLIFDYDGFFGGKATEQKVTKALADLTLFGVSGFFITTLFLFRRSDLRIIWGDWWSKRRSVLTGIGLALLLRLGIGLYLFIYRMFFTTVADTTGFLTARYDILSINEFYNPLLGLLIVVILAPIYEEVLFRGIFLSAAEKHMRFFWANSFQSLAFALIHQDLKLIPFYFAFGFVAGFFRNKTQGLATGISMHMTNNLLAFLALLR